MLHCSSSGSLICCEVHSWPHFLQCWSKPLGSWIASCYDTPLDECHWDRPVIPTVGTVTVRLDCMRRNGRAAPAPASKCAASNSAVSDKAPSRGSTSTVSPGMPSIRLQTVLEGSLGDIATTISPSRRPNPALGSSFFAGKSGGTSGYRLFSSEVANGIILSTRRNGSRACRTKSPEGDIVGSIEAPLHCGISALCSYIIITY